MISGDISVSTSELADSRAQELIALVDRFSAQFPSHTGSLPIPGKETILVTGTTGSLGINVLKTLISLDSVQRIYAYNRGGSFGETSRDRHAKAARLQGIPLSVVDSPKIVYVEGDVSVENLGLPDNIIDEVKKTVTSILHLGRSAIGI